MVSFTRLLALFCVIELALFCLVNTQNTTLNPQDVELDEEIINENKYVSQIGTLH